MQIPTERIERSILMLRDQRVILDADLARFYQVSTKVLNQAVKRNLDRFPADFMITLTAVEIEDLRSQFVTSSSNWGGRRTRPNAFTEQGVAMLASVLHSPRAVQISIAIVRAFVRLRAILATHHELAKRIQEIERQFGRRTDVHEAHIQRIYKLLDEFMNPSAPAKSRIGFRTAGTE